MMKKAVALGKILKAGLLPNLIKDRLDPVRVVAAAVDAGVEAVEVSCRRPDTIELIKRLHREFPELAIGVSSLIEDGPYFRFLQQRGPRFPSIDDAVDAGADFLVSLISFSPQTYRRHVGLPMIPGVNSADEAKRQLDLGASFVKFSNCSAERLKTINGGPIHFGLPLLVTGGVRPQHIADYVSVGVLVAVCGFDLILSGRYEALQSEYDVDEVRSSIGLYVEKFAEARTKHRTGVDFGSGDPFLVQRQTGQFMNADSPPGSPMPPPPHGDAGALAARAAALHRLNRSG